MAMTVDPMRQLQDLLVMRELMMRNQSTSANPLGQRIAPQERFDPDVLLNLLVPNLISPKEQALRMYKNDGVPNPNPQDVQDAIDDMGGQFGPDQEIQQTPQTMEMNKGVWTGRNKDIVI